MPYAVKPNGDFRAVAEDTLLEEGEALYDDLPEWVSTLITATRNAEIMRVTELRVISRQLEAIEEAEVADPGDEPVDLLAGTRKQWLKYRSLVSNWVQGAAGYPDQISFPVRPS